jgi:hypothetical protein
VIVIGAVTTTATVAIGIAAPDIDVIATDIGTQLRPSAREQLSVAQWQIRTNRA